MRRLIHAEWTKFRTVPSWLIGLAVGAALMTALGVSPTLRGSCGQHGPGSECVLPVGPDGVEITDTFTFVHRTLAGDGTVTARVASLTGLLPALGDGEGPGAPVAQAGNDPQGRPGLAPWAKAGLIIKDGTKPGSTYAAVMLTGSHGVRMQYDYLYDQASTAAPASPPRWLRLTRAGPLVTGEESADGMTWTPVGTARLDGLPATAEVGLFVTSPQYTAQVSVNGSSGGPSQATATFDQLGGAFAEADWTTDGIGGTDNGPFRPGAEATATGFTLAGSGDIAPAVAGPSGSGTTISQTLLGTFVALIFAVVVGAMFATGEYRRGLIRTTIAASPGRIRVLVAKAVVLGGAAFVVGLVAAAIVVTFGQRVLRDNGVYVHPASTGTEVRLILGTAALLAVGAVLALALGTVLRRSATAVTTAVVAIVLPYLLTMTILPAAAGQWLLRISPAAAFAVQQSAAAYPQVDNVYTPAGGYFPLPPWGGFAVLGVWAVLALAVAGVLLRRRDA